MDQWERLLVQKPRTTKLPEVNWWRGFLYGWKFLIVYQLKLSRCNGGVSVEVEP